MTSDGSQRDQPEGAEPPAREYGTHADYIARVQQIAAARAGVIGDALRSAFAAAMHTEELEVIDFTALTVFDLARALAAYPAVMKPLLAARIPTRSSARSSTTPSYKSRSTSVTA